MKPENRITLVLCANLYVLIFMYSTTLVSLTVSSILGELYGQSFSSSWCVFRGYFVSAMLCALYIGFVVQVSHELERLINNQKFKTPAFS